MPPWHETTKTHGIIGTPLVETNARFVRPASYGDDIEVRSSIEQWGNKSFRMVHRIRRGDTELAEIVEKRVFAARHPEDPTRMQAVPIPEDFKAKCE